MCGIIGYVGKDEAKEVLISGLKTLEYRGYDSAGLAVFGEEIVCVKAKGKIENLEKKLAEKELLGKSGIGHTRWATHGEPDEKNAHPHASRNLVLVHNGIIENHLQLKRFLQREGYSFLSDTDTESAAHLIDFYFEKSRDPFKALVKAAEEIKGSYAFCVIFKNDSENFWSIRKGSPLLCAHTESGSYLASDITALLPYANEYCEIEENTVIKAGADGVTAYSFDEKEQLLVSKKINWSAESAKKSGYDHFMLKEISEQPKALKNTVDSFIKDDVPYFDCDILDGEKPQFDSIKIIACGTAMHAGFLGKSLIENIARIPVSVEIASEFRYGNPILNEKTLVIAISQSGETADTLAALQLAKKMGLKTVAVVNAVGSTMSRIADYVLYTKAGPEISVASTKAYTVQCAVMYLLALHLARVSGRITLYQCEKLCAKRIEELIKAIEETLELQDKIKEISKSVCKAGNLFFIGRGIDYYVCMEGSLKLKEISYIHSEAIAAGELKHGTISLIEQGMPIIALSTVRDNAEKTASNIREAKTRGATIISVCTKECEEIIAPVSDFLLTLPKVAEFYAPAVAAVVFQLLAYYTACLLGNDVDKPRNLAKSVTVE